METEELVRLLVSDSFSTCLLSHLLSFPFQERSNEKKNVLSQNGLEGSWGGVLCEAVCAQGMAAWDHSWKSVFFSLDSVSGFLADPLPNLQLVPSCFLLDGLLPGSLQGCSLEGKS